MMYKIVDGYLQSAPREFIEDGRRIIGFTEDFLRERGYKPVVWSEPISDGQMDYYEETEDAIIQHWK